MTGHHDKVSNDEHCLYILTYCNSNYMSCVDISDIIVYYFAIVMLMACECVYIMYDQGVINKCELFFTA